MPSIPRSNPFSDPSTAFQSALKAKQMTPETSNDYDYMSDQNGRHVFKHKDTRKLPFVNIEKKENKND